MTTSPDRAGGLHDPAGDRLTAPGSWPYPHLDRATAAIPPGSWYGTLLKGIFNFSPATTWLEAVTWLAYVGTVLTIFIVSVRRHAAASAPIAPTAQIQGAS